MTENEEKKTLASLNPQKDPRPQDAKASRAPARRLWRKVAVISIVAVVMAAGLYSYFRPPAEDSSKAAVPLSAERKVLYWQDPMHPQYRSDKPGKAPDCGMDLVPVYEGATQGAESLPEGAFRVTPERQQLIGVQYGKVTRQPLSTSIRAVGRLTFDETRIARIHSKVAGWIEKVFVDFTGKLVAKNQPLLSVYSPELVATQEEYLLALKGQARLGNSPFKEVAAGAESLLEAARRRLELWDLTTEQIKELDKTQKPSKAVTLYSPASGFVMTRNAYEGQRIMPETELYAIADLSTIWVIADIYEYEAPLVRLGQSANMTLSYFPGRTFRGKVTYIYPQLDNATRTIKVRAEFSNPDFALKPDMYADVDLRIDYGSRLSVPQEAVLDSGSEQTVFVALDRGYFDPRKVRLGGKVGESYIVLDGVRAGERVVTSGNFLIDSESRLRSAAGGMGMPGMQHGPAGETPKQPAAPTGHPQHQGMDPSKHQTGASEPKAPDHSQHGKKPEEHRHD